MHVRVHPRTSLRVVISALTTNRQEGKLHSLKSATANKKTLLKCQDQYGEMLLFCGAGLIYFLFFCACACVCLHFLFLLSKNNNTSLLTDGISPARAET